MQGLVCGECCSAASWSKFCHKVIGFQGSAAFICRCYLRRCACLLFVNMLLLFWDGALKLVLSRQTNNCYS